MTARLALSAAFALAASANAAAQQVRTAVVPDPVLVGDVFHVAVRVDLPAGVTAELPDTLAVSGDLENAGPRRDSAEPLDGGGRRLTFAYPLTAWRPGPAGLPAVPLRMTGPRESDARELDIELPDLRVRSVLPAGDTAGVQPRPLKDVFGANWILWPFLLAALAFLAAGVGAAYWYRRRRGPAVPIVPGVPPSKRALAALDHARTLGLLERGEFKAFYSLVTAAVRGYLDEIHPAWGAELTTTELMHCMSGSIADDERRRLGRVLNAADMVKFAKRRPRVDEAVAEWQAARDWIQAHGVPAAPVPAEAA